MKIDYIEWRTQVKFGCVYDSAELWKIVKEKLDEEIKFKIIKIPSKILEKINEETIINIMSFKEEVSWTEKVDVKICNGKTTILYDYLEELCDDAEYEITSKYKDILDDGDFVESDRKFIKE